MKLYEILKTRRDLDWSLDQNEYFSSFDIDDRSYGISVIIEEHDDKKFAHVDFHLKTENDIQHGASNLNKDMFKIIGIVTTGVTEKFSSIADGFFFLAKSQTGTDEYNSRVKLYLRIIQKMSIEHNLIKFNKDLSGEHVFALCKNEETMNVFKTMI